MVIVSQPAEFLNHSTAIDIQFIRIKVSNK